MAGVKFIVPGLIAAFVAAGCGFGVEAGVGPGGTGTPGAAETAPPRLVSLAESARRDPDGLAPLLTADLAGRTGLPAGSLVLVAFEERTWPNGCLGLARGGEMCSQALVPGWLATLAAPDGRLFRYRGSGGRFELEP